MARFTLLMADDSARSFELDGDELLIGRQAEADIQLRSTTVSRRHAVIKRQGSRHVIEDLGSVNGITVLARRVASHVLEAGDRVKIEQFTLVFEPPADVYAYGLKGGQAAGSSPADYSMTFVSADGFGLGTGGADQPTVEGPGAGETNPDGDPEA